MEADVLENGVTALRGTNPARAGRAESDFSEFFAASWPRMYRTALAICGDASHAEDAVQSAYAKAFARWRRVSATEHPDAYVRRMVVNEALGTFRRPWRQREQSTDSPPETGQTAAPEGAALDRHDLMAALATLAPGQRAVLVLRYYEDLSEAEIAEALGVSRGTVKSQASAALAALRTKEITR